MRPLWSRLYEHGIALAHDVSERIDDARPSFERALAEAPDERARAQVRLELARLDAALGRLDRALALANAVEAAVGAHPAIDRVRGDAYARVWQWEAAAEAYARVADAAPLDTAAHRDLARAFGALGRADDVIRAAAPGLALQPRDEGLLRSVALAHAAREPGETSNDGPSAAEAAMRAYLEHRTPDEATALRLRCDAHEPDCARDRLPIPTLELRP